MRSKKPNYSSAKSERFEARMSKNQKDILQYAADLSGRSLTDFVLMASQEAANKLIRDNDIISLTAEESRKFADLLLNPPPINDAMKKALDNYDNFFSHPNNKTDIL